MARICFLGTPTAATPTLTGLTDQHDVALVVTQPDRPKGRSRKIIPGPVKSAASELGLPIAQPEDRDELLATLEAAAPFDVGVVVAYGRILRPEVLDLPEHGMLNVHFSLLPRWRGAAPVSRALIEGDTMTGVTVIRLDEGLDTGPVLTAQALDIRKGENAGDLTERLASMGARLLVSSLDSYLQGDLVAVEQSDEGASYADKVSSTDRRLSAAVTAPRFVNRVRGLAPDPGATLQIDGDCHKILDAEAAAFDVEQGSWLDEGGWPLVGVEGGSVKLVRLQSPGRKPMAGDDWLRGRRVSGGTVD